MGHNGKDMEKLVAIVSPWEKLPVLARRNFRIESLPTEKKVQVWRDDLQSPELLTAELTAGRRYAGRSPQQPDYELEGGGIKRRMKDEGERRKGVHASAIVILLSSLLRPPPFPHSHSIVAGGFELMS